MEKLPGGGERIRFEPPPPDRTNELLEDSVALWNEQRREKRIPPLVLLAAFNLDFLCIHPFRDGNGRVSRILLLLQLYHLGYEIGRYISIEKIIEDNKQRYYDSLEESSRQWHAGANDPWPFTNFLLFVLKEACALLEERLESLSNSRGTKTDLIVEFVAQAAEPFSIADIQYHCPGVGIDLIRKVLKRLQAERKVRSLGRGRSAKWETPRSL